ncbi:MAG: type II secretion system protein [Candidatus Pacebacteria bacterium]|nr:type II secretion system protein [Candidatus Paceibacterota bacterium]MBP9840586.1 type II secretion system protein [Candidatus Paceibacterota bacterium]
MRNPRDSRAGFTLIEILVVIGLIAVLAGVVLVALNPSRQFAQARNTERTANVTALLNAIGARVAENKGTFAGEFTAAGETYECPSIATSTMFRIASDGSATIDLSCLTPTYIPARLPFDPSATGAHWTDAGDYDTGYTVEVDEFGRYIVAAPSAELEEEISVTR